MTAGLVYYPVLDMGLELSSMGIRVDEDSLKEQLKKAKCTNRAKLPFHKAILEGKLPYTVGGGIGQSRICMFFLRRAHIGEVQSSIWLDEDRKKAEKAGINLLMSEQYRSYLTDRQELCSTLPECSLSCLIFSVRHTLWERDFAMFRDVSERMTLTLLEISRT